MHFYGLSRFPVRLWHPVELVGYMLFRTIWRGEPVHCNVEIDGLIYDNSLNYGLRVLGEYPIEPMRSIEVNCKFKGTMLCVYHSLAQQQHPKWPAILDSLGVWPKRLTVPYTCVSVSCILLGLPILESRRPVHLLRRLIDGNFRITQSTASTATAAARHVGSGRDEGAQETREG